MIRKYLLVSLVVIILLLTSLSAGCQVPEISTTEDSTIDLTGKLSELTESEVQYRIDKNLEYAEESTWQWAIFYSNMVLVYQNELILRELRKSDER